MPKILLYFFFVGCVLQLSAQTVYKTPSGAKYHTATCRYVKNVSEKLSKKEAEKQGLKPCSVCMSKVSGRQATGSGLGIKSGEAQGEQPSQRCRAMTKAGRLCKRTTRNTNGFCFQHEQ